MLIRFNWNRILRAGSYQPKKVFNLFQDLAKNETPEKKYTNLYRLYGKDFSGYSFLAYPETLFEYAYAYSYRDLCCYLSLAATRSLAEYRRAGVLTLPLELSKINPKEYLTDQTLCPIDIRGTIHFLYEQPLEVARENINHSTLIRDKKRIV